MACDEGLAQRIRELLSDAAVARTLLLAVALVLTMFAACQVSRGEPESIIARATPLSGPAVTETVALPPLPQPAVTAPSADGFTAALVPPSLGITFQRSDGNRLAAGKGAMPITEPLDIPLDGRPLWVVGAPFDGRSLWVVVLDDGRIKAFVVSDGAAQSFAISPTSLPPGMPPLLLVYGEDARLITNPVDDASPLTHPTLLATAADTLVFLDHGGNIIMWEDDEIARLSVAGIHDARILADESSHLLLLTGPTDRYQHGVLGDAIEASRITLLQTSPALRVATQIELPHPDVVEGIAPIWSDLNGDGQREIIVTVSNEMDGARIIVFDEQGEQLAAGPPIGRGYRWRHQIAVAPFGTDGQLELAAVLTPHIGGRIEYYRLSGNELQIVASLAGFSSHALGTRNLDAGVAGDFDGDGQVELALPDQVQQTLSGVRRTTNGAEVAWTVSIGGRISTNLAAVTRDNVLALGVGHDGNKLRIWSP